MSTVEQVRPIDDVVTAVKAAQSYLQTVRPDQAQQLLLEEIEAPEGGHNREWKVTFSWPTNKVAGGASVFMGFARDYKTVTIDADTGSLRSIKIRTV